MKVAKNIGFKLPSVIGVARYASSCSAHVNTGSFAIVRIEPVHRQDTEDINVLAIE